MSADDTTHYFGDGCPGGHHDELAAAAEIALPAPSPFTRGDVLLVTNMTCRPEFDAATSVLRVLAVDDMPDGMRLTVERMTGEAIDG